MTHRISQLRQRAGISQAELAAKAGVTQSMIGKLERGHRQLTMPMMRKLAAALDVEVGDILEPAMSLATEPDIAPTIAIDEGDQVLLRQVDVAYSMGPGSEIQEYPDEGAIGFDAAMIRSITRSSPDSLFIARGFGDSMFPTLVEGDQVMIDTAQRTLNAQDRVWAINLHGAGAVKRLRMVGRGRVLIVSDNPTIDDYEVDAADLHITGRLIWFSRRM